MEIYSTTKKMTESRDFQRLLDASISRKLAIFYYGYDYDIMIF